MMTGVLLVKPGVAFTKIRPAGFRILGALEYFAYSRQIALTITSGSEGTWRRPDDPHMTGEAFDVSVLLLTPEQVAGLRGQLIGHLGSAFTVLYEVPSLASTPDSLRGLAYVNPKATAPHFHIQRKKGTVFP